MHVAMDFGISVCSGAAALYVNFLLFDSNPFGQTDSSLYTIAAALTAVAFLQLICNRSFDLYRSYRSTRFLYEMTDIFKAGLSVFAVLVALALTWSQLGLFQVPLMFYFFIDTFITSVYRYILRKFLRYVRKKGYNKKYIILIGTNDCTESFIKKIQSSPNLGYEIAGYFDPDVHQEYHLKRLGSFRTIHKYLAQCHPDEAVIMLSDQTQPEFDRIVADCEGRGIKFSIIPNMFSNFSTRIYISNFDGIPVMSMRKVPLENTLNKIVKRTMDIIVSLLMLILLSPLMLITALIIRLTSKGPVIFRQERVGIDNKPFIMYKFRSMRIDIEPDVAMTEKNDPRCTKFGRFIRRFSIDELPQLFNVLRGNMSLVGPRPEIPYYVEQFRKSIPLYMVKHYIKPGITGWAQVNDLRGGDTSIEERIKYDIYYIENWSVAFDVSILLRTLTKVINSKSAR